MELSGLLIAHRLDRDVGLRLAAALRMKDPTFEAKVTGLLQIAKRKDAKIDAPDAEVFAYELALMYQPTSDVMTIPSYAISAPNGWTSKAPPAQRDADAGGATWQMSNL